MTVPRRTYRRYSRFGRQSRSFYRQMRAMRQQRDAGRFTIKTRVTFPVRVPGGENYGYAVMTAWQILSVNPQFTALKTLFDQVKINGMSIDATSTVQPALTVAYLPTFTYCWDRNGREGSGNAQADYERVASYGSSMVRTITAGTHNSFRTHIVAQDLQERTMFISTDDMGNVSETSEITQSFFKPTFMAAVHQPAQVNDDTDYVWEMDVAIDVTFRGTRYCN